MKAAELFVKCLENEKVEYIFGIPGEENIDVMDALLDSPIRFVTAHHEQGAAFMADVYGRLTGRAGVCMSTLGPGATNLITGVADANMDRAPLVAIAGQGATTRLHKESHQILNLVNMFRPITKYATQILDPGIVPEIVRKAFKVAQTEKPGGVFIDFPENIAEMSVDKVPIRVQTAYTSEAPASRLDEAARLISAAKAPVILAGNGVIRQGAADSLVTFAEVLRVPVANTFMAKGVMPFSNEFSLGTIGMKSRDLPWFAFEKADLVICVGYDMVEYHPDMWNPDGDKTIIHIDALPAEVDGHYIVAQGVLGDIHTSLRAIALRAKPQATSPFKAVRKAIVADRAEHSQDTGFPVKPQKIVWDLREVLAPDDIVISDVGAHKMWMSRMYRAERPNTCIIPNGFAAMGIAVPGAIAAKLAYPERKVVAVTGDAGFMMNSQEIETALRMKASFVVLIWNDSEYGLITWHQLRHFGRPSHIEFKNPDFVKYAESFGAKGYRLERTQDLMPTLQRALEDDTVVIIDCPVDYAENMKLTHKLQEMTSPLRRRFTTQHPRRFRMKIRAAVLDKMGATPPYATSKPLAITNVELAPPGRGEVLIKVAAAGLCHSDLSVINGDRPRPMPMALGHEAAGIVEQLGEGVTDLQVGDPVVVVFVPSCGHCAPCAEGRPALCEPGAAANGAGTLLSGARRLARNGEPLNHHLGCSVFAEYATVSRHSVIKIDREVPLDEAALFGCAVLTGVGAVVNTAQVRVGASVAVIGLGGVGLAALIGAHAAGARQIIAVDLAEDKLEQARELGATHTVNAGQADALEQIRALSSGGVEFAFEFAGSIRALELAYRVTRRGGSTVTAGLPPSTAMLPLPAVSLVAEERTLKGSYIGTCVPSRDIPRYIDLYRQGRLPVNKLLTGRLALDEINHGFDLLHEGKAIRQVVVFE